MIKGLLKKPWLQSLVAALAALYIWLVWITTSWKFKNDFSSQISREKTSGFIFCFWHARLFMLAPAWRRWKTTTNPYYMLISDHKDGRIISKTVAYFGIKTIYGSSNRSGQKALKQIVHQLKQGSFVGFTPDGPRGPREVVSLGIIQAAYLSQSPIVPVAYGCTKKKIFNTWDRFLLPYPFGRGRVIWGEPIPAPTSKSQFEATRLKVQEALNQVCRGVDAAQ